VGETLDHQLDDACEASGLEWLVMPFERDEAWQIGPYWGALLVAQRARRRGRPSRSFQYN